MKKFITLSLMITVLASCHKDPTIRPNNAAGPVSGNAATGNTTLPVAGAGELLHYISITGATQNVKTSVTDKTLTLVYTEDVNAILSAKGYDQSFSIRFNEDFSKSVLKNFTFTTTGINGNTTVNWAGNNLKVLDEVATTTTPTTTTGQNAVVMHLRRDFKFTKEYATALEAQQMEETILNAKTDVVTFTAYVAFDIDYPSTTITKPVVYSK